MFERLYSKLNYIVGLLPYGLLLGVVAFVAHVEIRDLDLWLHIAMGRFISIHQFVPTVDILSNSYSGVLWVNHEWLFQVIVYSIYERWGTDGILQMQVCVVIFTMLVLLFLGYSRQNQFLPAFLLTIVFLVYQQRFTTRPDLFSLMFFALYIFVLALHIDKRWAPVTLFVIQILWANMHGFFFFGPLFILIGIVSELIKRYIPLPWEWNESGRLTSGEFKNLWFSFALVFLACFLTPSLVEGAIYPVRVFFSMGGENKIFFSFIQELQKPILSSDVFDTRKFIYYKLLIFFSLVSFILNRRRIDISAFFFWLVFFIFSLKAVRNTPYFAFASYLVIITNTINLSYKDVLPIRFIDKKFEDLTMIFCKVILMLWLVQYANNVLTLSYYDVDKYEFKSEFEGVSTRAYPKKAVDFLIENNITGNFFNDFNSGAYLLGRTYPDIKVFIDGRTEVYGAQFFNRYRKIWDEGNEEEFEKAVEEFQLTGAFLNATRHFIPRKLMNYLYKSEEWKLVYFDFDGLVFLKDVPKNKKVIARHEIDLNNWQTVRYDLARINNDRVIPIENYYRAYSLESLDFDEQALGELEEVLKLDPTYADAYHLMGKIFAKQERYEEAFIAVRQAAVLFPHKKEVNYNLALAYEHLENYDAAIRHYEQMRNIWPNEIRIVFQMSRAYAKAGNFDKAIEFLIFAQKVAPDLKENYIKIGDEFYDRGAYNEAQQAYNFVLQHDQKDAEAYEKLGLVFNAIGDLSKARDSFKRALSLNPEDQELAGRVYNVIGSNE